jgi:hypothetical protein
MIFLSAIFPNAVERPSRSSKREEWNVLLVFHPRVTPSSWASILSGIDIISLRRNILTLYGGETSPKRLRLGRLSSPNG